VTFRQSVSGTEQYRRIPRTESLIGRTDSAFKFTEKRPDFSCNRQIPRKITALGSLGPESSYLIATAWVKPLGFALPASLEAKSPTSYLPPPPKSLMGMTFSHLTYFQRHSGSVYIRIPLALWSS